MESGPKPYLTFRAGRRHFAIEACRVRGILPVQELAPLSGIRPAVLGLTSLSGRPVAVWDLSRKLDLPRAAVSAARHIVVVSVREHMAAFTADRVSGVESFRARELRKGWLHGAGRVRRLLDIEKLFADEDLMKLTTAGPEPPVHQPPAIETAPAAFPH